MLVAIDFDGTFAADPDFWRCVVELGRSRGHSFVLVTGRGDHVMRSDPSRHWGDEVRQTVNGLLPIVFAGHDRTKRQAAAEAGFQPDVWVDDYPESVGERK